MPVVILRDVSEIPRAMYEGLSAMLKEPGLPEGEIAGLKEQMERLAAYLRETGTPIPDTDEPAMLLLDSADLQAVLGDRNFDIPPHGDGPPRSRDALFLDLPSEEEVDQLIAELAALSLSDILWVVGRDEATFADRVTQVVHVQTPHRFRLRAKLAGGVWPPPCPSRSGLGYIGRRWVA